MPPTDDELSYYRAVEDFFAAARGAVHVLSPKDFQLLREWWRQELPLAAVTSGITEVVARRAERGDASPVVSLSYCRHAVLRHAARLAEMRVGEAAPDSSGGAEERPSRSVGELTDSLRGAAFLLKERFPEASAVISSFADQLETVPEMPPAALEQHLFSLELVLLERCWQTLPEEERERIAVQSGEAAAAAGADASIRKRTERAFRDRELRRLLGLARLELW